MPMRFARALPPATIAELVDAQHRHALALRVVGGTSAVASVYIGVAYALLADELGEQAAADRLVDMARAAAPPCRHTPPVLGPSRRQTYAGGLGATLP